jgi:hypothetical protein
MAIPLFGLAQKDSAERVVMLDCGHGLLRGGQCLLPCPPQAKGKNPVILLTPAERYQDLYVESRNSSGIVVRSRNATEGEFDYIIVVKERYAVLSNSKSGQ